MKTTISAMEARKNFGHFLNIVALTDAEVTIERAGKPIARLVGIHDQPRKIAGTSKLNLCASRGLGQELWRAVNVDAYLSGERAAWD